MTDDRKPRPLSGEIMAAREPERRTGERRAGDRRVADAVDAEFITVGPASDRTGTAPAGGRAGADASPGMDILKGKAADRGVRRGGPLFWTFGLCLVFAAFWVSGGHALVSRPQADMPQSVRAAAPGALRLSGITSRIERRDDRFFLHVDGEVVNAGSAGASVPGLEISVAGKDGRVTRYFLGTSGERLEPGGRFAFSSRLEAPKDGVETVTVDFRKEG
jgi:hypothetical protein